MPANLTPEFIAARNRLQQAKSDEERLDALQDMLATIPKHKGTEKMQADIRRRIAKLKDKAEQRRKSGKGGATGFHVEREGAAQLALVGPPNVGKSALLAALTNAHPDVAPYPMSTFKPLPGMMLYEDVQVQLVDLPPISAEYTEGWVYGIVRLADAVVLCWDLASDAAAEDMEQVIELLGERMITLSDAPSVALDWRAVRRRTVVIGLKADLAPEGVDTLSRWAEGRFPWLAVSTTTGAGLEECRRLLFGAADIVRVYTKKPGKPADMGQPYTVKQGDTVTDVVAHIHREFVDKLRFVRIWGSTKFEGQHAPLDHPVQDGDVLEIHLV